MNLLELVNLKWCPLSTPPKKWQLVPSIISAVSYSTWHVLFKGISTNEPRSKGEGLVFGELSAAIGFVWRANQLYKKTNIFNNFRRRYFQVPNHILVGNILCCIVLLEFQIPQVSKIPSNLSQLESKNYPFNPKNSYQIILASPDLGLYEWNQINCDDVGDDGDDDDDDDDKFEPFFYHVLHAFQTNNLF